MDQIKDMLNSSRFAQPDEIARIKQYVQDRFRMNVEVLVRDKDILITTGSAGLANSLRLEMPKLQKAAETDKKLLFRIG